MELIKVGERTYYIKNATNIGVYVVEDNKVFLIDTGNDKDAGKNIMKIMNENGFEVVGIINTHSHADHVGGNKLIQDRTSCNIYSYGIESAITNYPLLEPSLLYGGSVFKELKNKSLMAKESTSMNIDNLPDGLEYFLLRGHYFDMIGIKTSDDVYFLGDSLFSNDTINKYHIFYLYDVGECLNTLNYLRNLKGKLFILSHAPASDTIGELIDNNEKKIYEVCDTLIEICSDGKTFDDILKGIFDYYNLDMSINQYVLIGSTIRSYLSYLYDNERLIYTIDDNKLYWKKKETTV